MPILLCAATEFEIKPTIEWIQKQSFNNIQILITGVGLTAATYQLTKAIYKHKPRLLLQAGVAGCLDENLSLAKVVTVRNEVIGDLGVEENKKFNSLFDLKLCEPNTFPWTNGKLTNDSILLNQTDLPIVDSVSINEISTNKERIRYYKSEWGASIESMEGAALHYVGIMEKIPFLQIRSLSNFAGERDKGKWLLKDAIGNLNIELQRLLTNLLSL
jgi:futalosine hydrolase